MCEDTTNMRHSVVCEDREWERIENGRRQRKRENRERECARAHQELLCDGCDLDRRLECCCGECEERCAPTARGSARGEEGAEDGEEHRLAQTREQLGEQTEHHRRTGEGGEGQDTMICEVGRWGGGW